MTSPTRVRAARITAIQITSRAVYVATGSGGTVSTVAGGASGIDACVGVGAGWWSFCGMCARHAGMMNLGERGVNTGLSLDPLIVHDRYRIRRRRRWLFKFRAF